MVHPLSPSARLRTARLGGEEVAPLGDAMPVPDAEGVARCGGDGFCARWMVAEKVLETS